MAVPFCVPTSNEQCPCGPRFLATHYFISGFHCVHLNRLMLFHQGLKGCLTQEVKGGMVVESRGPWALPHGGSTMTGGVPSEPLTSIFWVLSLPPVLLGDTRMHTHTHTLLGPHPMPCFPLNAEETSFLCTFHALADGRDLWCMPAQSLCAWLEKTELMRELSEIIPHVLWGGF